MKRFTIAISCSVIACCSCASGPSAKLPMPIDDSATAQRSEADPRVRKYILPVRVVWHSAEGVENPGVLLQKRTDQVTLDASDPCTLRTKGAGAGLLLDFGVELHGGVQIMGWHSKANKPVRLRVRFGESVSEAMAELAGEKNATNDHAIRDQSCLLPWLGTAEIGNTGFRFVRIDLEDTDSFV
ncbi:MAG: alpha-L-rhamnosidase, partial [Planctomycetota bacterium]